MRSDIGDFRSRVTLIDPYGVVAEEIDGQPRVSPRTVAAVWAQVTPVTGTERETGERVQTDLTHTVRIRFREDVRAAGARWQLAYRGRRFEVRRALDADEMRRFLILECVEQFAR